MSNVSLRFIRPFNAASLKLPLKTGLRPLSTVTFPKAIILDIPGKT